MLLGRSATSPDLGEVALCKATAPRSGDVADLPNTQIKAERKRQNKETNEYVPSEGTGQNLRKRTKKKKR